MSEALVTPLTVIVAVAGAETFPSESVRVNWKLSVPTKPGFAMYVNPPSSLESNVNEPLLAPE